MSVEKEDELADILETLEILSDSAAMDAINSAKQDQGFYRTLDLEDENFGL
jgi:hypothetical protein